MKQNLAELVFILDRSGSMQGLEGDPSKAKSPYTVLVNQHSIG